MVGQKVVLVKSVHYCVWFAYCMGTTGLLYVTDIDGNLSLFYILPRKPMFNIGLPVIMLNSPPLFSFSVTGVRDQPVYSANSELHVFAMSVDIFFTVVYICMSV